MKAVILAAGYATRLYPLTIDKPKCLLTVGGQTILDSLCNKLITAKDIDEIIVVTNARFFEQLNNWKTGRRAGVPITILNDETTSNDNRLGAIGDLRFSIERCSIDSDILMMASDNLFQQSLSAFYDFAKSKKDAITVALYDIKDKSLAAKKFGVLEINKENEVIGIEEKPEQPKSSLIGMGIYHFPKSSLKFVNEFLNHEDANDAPGHYIRWLVGRTKVFGFLFSGMWYDIGNLQALEEANRTFKI